MLKDIWLSNEDIWRSIWRKYGLDGGVMRIYGEEYMIYEEDIWWSICGGYMVRYMMDIYGVVFEEDI